MKTNTEDRIEKLLRELTREEKASLTAGLDLWHTKPITRLGIPSLKLSDGPNGVRGESSESHPVSSASFPVGTALAATWNPELVKKIGAALGREALSKNVQVLLGPTVNMHRVPLAGRNFECFSEDPYLASIMAVAYIQGVQSEGVAACAKHLVGNDQEHERFSISAEISERALEEIYFPPFKAAVTKAGVLAVMSAYNRLNGTYASEHAHLLVETLKKSWGFDGLVISDWYGTYSEKAASGGCDLEMPGPARWMGKRSLQYSNAPDQEVLDDQIRRLLRIIFATQAFKSTAKEEVSQDLPADKDLIRQAGRQAIVLLKNEGNLLPLNPAQNQKIALIGQLAGQISVQGGGSSQVTPHYIAQPLDAMRDQHQGEILYAKGYDIRKQPPPMDRSWFVEQENQSGPLSVSYYANTAFEGKPVHEAFCAETNLAWFGETAEHFNPQHFSLRIQGSFRPPETKEYILTLSLIGRGRVQIGQETILDLWDKPAGDHQVKARLVLDASRSYPFVIEYLSDLEVRWRMVRLGVESCQELNLVNEAVKIAAEADVALIVVGLTPEWESEGFDRDSLALPGDQDELIRKVAQVNPNTVVVVNAGSPILMPWKETVPVILQAWYLGQEGGNALTDVILGRSDPGGRLPTTFPAKLEDHPAYHFYPGEQGRVAYQEDIFMGYRHYDLTGTIPLFPFGHGLSYTTFEYHDLQLTANNSDPNAEIELTLNLTNSGKRTGWEVVQLYLSDVESALPRPPQELKGFRKVCLEPGESIQLIFNLSRSDLAYYDADRKEWVAEPGEFIASVGSSSADIKYSKKFHWGHRL